MEEQDNETHWSESGPKTTYLRWISKGRLVSWRWWCCYLSTDTYAKYLQTATNLMMLLRTSAIYCSLVLVCAGNKVVQLGRQPWGPRISQYTLFCGLVFHFKKRKTLLVQNFILLGVRTSPSWLKYVTLTHFIFWKSKTTGVLLIWCTRNSKMMIWSVWQNCCNCNYKIMYAVGCCYQLKVCILKEINDLRRL
jgi:hypothetical protein